MKVRNLLLFIVLCLFYSCSSLSRDSRLSPGSSDIATGAEYQSQQLDSVEIFQARFDSVVSLFEFGDLTDFAQARDSLHNDLLHHLRHSSTIPPNTQLSYLLQELDKLDSLAISKKYRHAYLAETDSLALSSQEWPAEHPIYVDTITNTINDTIFPKIENERIDFWIRYFTGPGKSAFSRSLFRMERHRKTIEDILDHAELPKPLLCIPLIESGFNLKARSRARAVGPWQFIAGTARIYGLRVNWWLDERRDIVASSYAATNYLRDLYELWNSWFLAMAAYNSGEFRVAKAVVRQKTEDFWKLKLPKQTQRYIPKFLAALYIVRDPEKYGFTLPEVEALDFDVVTVKSATDLDLIAELSDSDIQIIKELNPALLRYCTPPHTEIDVKVPKGKGEICRQRLAEIPASKRVSWQQHRIRQGETLWQIARKYKTTILTLKRLNGLRSSHLIRAGHMLIVPLKGKYVELASTKPQYKTKRRQISKEYLESYAKRSGAPSGYKEVIYEVKDHDTLGEIAEIFHTRASKLRLWNNLSYRSYIYPGQKLTVYVPQSFKIPANMRNVGEKHSREGYVKTSYTVKKGDSLYRISRKFNVKVSDLLAWNSKGRKAVIYPGEKIEIWQKR